MRNIFILICLLLTEFSDAQQFLTFPIFQNDFHFNWKEMETHVSRSDVERFIQDHPHDFEAYRQKDKKVFRLNVDSLYKDLHFLDLNGDGKNDVIFDGEGGGEARLIEIFICHGSNFEKQFSVIQGIVKLDWQDGRLEKIYIRDWGCCDDYLEFLKIYGVHYDERNNPAFNQIYQSIVIYQAKVPDSILETPVHFEILNEAYNIRSAPIKDDTSFQHWNDDTRSRGSGNIIGKIVKGAQGLALAKTIDDYGREWLYVEINEEYLLSKYLIYPGNKFPTKLRGWISSRFVKLL